MIIEGVEFSISNWLGATEPGVAYRYTSTPYSSRIEGDQVDPFKVEVGGYGGEYGITSEIRGMAEFPISGTVDSAILTFSVFRAGGMYYTGSYLITPNNPDPFMGTITVDAYGGDTNPNELYPPFDLNTDWRDYEAISLGEVGEIFMDVGITSVGTVFTFDVTQIWNEAIASGLTTLGIRLTQERSGEYGTNKAWTFQDFQITTIAEPSMIGLVLVGLVLLRRFK